MSGDDGILQALLEQGWIERLGWTLVHFLWQGLAVAGLLALALLILRRRSPQARYVAGCVAMLALAACPVVTFLLLPAPHGMVEAGATLIVPARVDDVVLAPPDAGTLAPSGSPDVPMAETPQRGRAADVAAWMGRAQSSIRPAMPWIVGAWSLGVLGLLVWHIAGWMGVQRLRTRGVGAVEPACQQMLHVLMERQRVSRPVRLVQSVLVEVPTVVGWLRPMILLPACALSGLTPEQLRAILAHELAHIRRHDYLINLLQTPVETLLFYHPAVWWISRHLRQEREHCCDDTAAAVCGNRVLYARALATMEELRLPTTGLAVAASGGALLLRIRRVLGVPTSSPGRIRSLASVLVVAAMLALVVGPQPRPSPRPTP